MASWRSGAHRGKIAPGAFAWREILCVLLAVLLAVYPLQPAYGEDAPAGSGDVSIESSVSDGDAATSAELVDAPEPVTAEGPADDVLDGAIEPPADESVEEVVEVPVDGQAQEPVADSDEEPAEPVEDAGDAPLTAVDGDPVAETDAEAEIDFALGAAEGETPSEATMPASRVAPEDGQGVPATVVTSPDSYKPTLAAVMGTIPLLVIVAGFAGSNGVGVVPYDDSYDWGDTIFASENGVSSYYSDMSLGAFTFTPAKETSASGQDGNTNAPDAQNDGVVHVTLNEAHGNWGDAYYTDGKIAGAMLATFGRILGAANSCVDFASYDMDGDGAIAKTELAIAFVVAGYEAALAGGDMPTGAYSLWSHAWSYSDAGLSKPKLDGVTLDDYIAIAEKVLGDSGAASDTQEPMSVLLHELGHYLGLPDLYDTTNDAGDWLDHAVDSASLMATGNWAEVEDASGKSSYVPAALDAWSRYELGWVTPTVVTKSGVYTVSAQDSKNGYTMLLIPTANKGEFYLIENRTFTGHDAGLASSYPEYENGGLIIWHIDNGMVERYLATNQVNGSAHRPGVAPLFPEESDDEWMYTLDYASSVPNAELLFWSKDMWERYFPDAKALDLPLYGSGKDANDPVARLLSGIRIQFLTDSGPDMRIRIFMPGDALPDEDPEVEDFVDEETPIANKAAAKVSVESEPASAVIPATGDELPVGAFAVAVIALIVLIVARRELASPVHHAKHAH